MIWRYRKVRLSLPPVALAMTLRQKLQTTLVVLIFVVLGLSAVTLWATLQWQRSDGGLREHYLRSLLLQEVRAGTYRALREVSDPTQRHDSEARPEFEALLLEIENDFRAWTTLATSPAEQRQVEEVLGAYSSLIRNARQVFELEARGRGAEASAMLEERIEKRDFPLFETLSTRAVDSDTQYRRHIQTESGGIRAVARVALSIAAAATIGLVALLAYFFRARLFQPMREVEQALAALGRGDLHQRIPALTVLGSAPQAHDELSMLVNAFNRTVDELSRTMVSKGYLDSIIESMVDALVVAGPDGVIRTANPAAETLYGVPREKMIGTPVTAFIPASDFMHEGTGDIETTACAGDARQTPVRLSRSVIQSADGDLFGVVFVAQDITERKRAEEQIRTALEEKEVLFKELNHRVKNNLQIIDSLLSLQARRLVDGREMLQESRDRIQAMALVHEMLYRSETPARIDVQEYLRELTSRLWSSYGGQSSRIRLAADIAAVSLSLDAAIPCGLIINELVTNSLKHAFPGEAGGEIAVELRALPDSHFVLSVRDDGIGLPDDFDIATAQSLGLRLVRTLAEQIGVGTLRVQGTGGTRFEMSFATALVS